MNNPWGPPGQQPYNQGPPQQQPQGGYGNSQQPYPGQQQYAPGPYRADVPVTMGPNEDESTLKILSILTYVHASLIGLVGLLYGGFGVLMAFLGASDALNVHGQKGVGDFNSIITIEGIFFAVFSLGAIAFAVLSIMCGRALTRRKSFAFVTVMSCVSLLLMPFGTLLGAFTLVTLNKPGVKAMFNRA